MKNISLYCKEGGSDKVYLISIEPKGDGFIVPFRFGPRDGTLQAGCKTPSPVPLAQAEKIFEKTLREKKAKGYTVGEDAPAYSQVEGAVDSGVRLMLLTDATGDEVLLKRLIADEDWGAEPKLNGKRTALRISGGNVTGVNRRGLECSIPKELQAAFTDAKGSYVADGELVGDTYHIFDALELDRDVRLEPLGVRKALAEEIAKIGRSRSDHIRFVSIVTGTREKALLVANLEASRREGVVLKNLGGLYLPGRIDNPKKAIAFKFKFYASDDFIVMKWNDKQSVELAAKDGKPVGNVTVPTKYASQVTVGGVIRVRYLFATGANKLYQPILDPTSDGIVMRGSDFSREDLTSIAQLKHEGREEE